MSVKKKVIISLSLAAIVLVLSIGIGSVYISAGDILAIIMEKVAGVQPAAEIDKITEAIIWKLRLPRTLLAFIVGSALAASGTVMQSVLKNPLASSYTLGVSSGAALGASIVIVFGLYLPFVGMFTLPLVGFMFGLATVFGAIGFASKIDRNMENHTVILIGMVLSLFVNALLTLITSLSEEHLDRIVFWQMGSFSLKDWSHVAILFPIVFASIVLLMRYSKEMDIMSFGEEHARAMGVETRGVKIRLLAISALITGSVISFVGIIGFVDLIAPHAVRKVFGSSHKCVLPMSAVFGGVLMVFADLIARTVISPSELPVGAVTALIGAPFFVYVFFYGSKGAGNA